MRVLCVAEKPSIAKSVANSLSQRVATRNSANKYIKNYDFDCTLAPWGQCSVTMTSVMGHLMSLEFASEYRAWRSCDPQELFGAPTVSFVSKDMQTVANNIRNESKKAQMLYIWTDCDREGENIGAEIANIARSVNPRIQIKRAMFNNIQRNHVLQAANSPIDLDFRQAEAVDARIEIDLRIGAAFTRFQTLLLQAALTGPGPPVSAGNKNKASELISYGSCQFPTLGFVVERYQRIHEFIAEPFWFIALKVRQKQAQVPFSWRRGHLFDRNAATVIYEKCLESGDMALVVRADTLPTCKWRPLPLTTVQLQKDGSKYLRMSSKAIMDTAESLYTKGYISYPRTETDQFDPSLDLQPLVSLQSSDPRWGEYVQTMQFTSPRRGSKNDKAHPPIYPVMALPSDSSTQSGITANMRKVYEFIARHFLACCSPDAHGLKTDVELEWGEERFQASGLTVTQQNFLEVYPYVKWSDKTIPEFHQGDRLKITQALLKDGKTTAPPHLTERDLIELMDKNGIGTDATIAEHIDKVIARQYVIKKASGRGSPILIPSMLGVGLALAYDRIAEDYSLTKPFLRREMELLMNRIASGQTSKQTVVTESLNKYRHVFAMANARQSELKSTVVTSVQQSA